MIKLFFERMKEKRGEVPTSFNYDQLPNKVRNQIIIIARESNLNEDHYKYIAEKIREATGNFKLSDAGHRGAYSHASYSYEDELYSYFGTLKNIDVALSIVELLGVTLSHCYEGQSSIDRINERMLSAGIGWKITGRELIQIEDETYFDNVTRPCLSVLESLGYKQAHKHFLDAYKELKDKEFDDALADCGQAIESIVKTRLGSVGVKDVTNKNWSQLKPLLLQYMVIPPYMQSYQNNLLGMVEGLMTARNKDGPHGKEEGANNQLDECFVRFAINQTAANILFIAEADFKK